MANFVNPTTHFDFPNLNNYAIKLETIHKSKKLFDILEHRKHCVNKTVKLPKQHSDNTFIKIQYNKGWHINIDNYPNTNSFFTTLFHDNNKVNIKQINYHKSQKFDSVDKLILELNRIAKLVRYGGLTVDMI